MRKTLITTILSTAIAVGLLFGTADVAKADPPGNGGYLVLESNDVWKGDNDGGFIVEVIIYER